MIPYPIARPTYKTHGMFTIAPDEADFVRRRVGAFLRSCNRYSLEHLLSEAYLAGLRDAQEVVK